MTFSFPVLAMVATGGALGSTLRYVLATALPQGVLWVNLAGSLLMGLLMGWLLLRAPAAKVWAQPLLAAGLLGGFTTFSAFAWEAWAMLERGAYLPALGYVMTSVAASIMLAGAGFYFINRMIAA